MDKDPFSYPLTTYAWVLGIAATAGLIKYLNGMQKFAFSRAVIEVITSGFTGVMTFWICKWGNIESSLLPFIVAVSGLMGTRAWQEFENFLRSRFPTLPPPQGTKQGASVGEQAETKSQPSQAQVEQP